MLSKSLLITTKNIKAMSQGLPPVLIVSRQKTGI